MATVKKNKSAEKRARQSVKRRRQNRAYKTAIKDVVKAVKVAKTKETAVVDVKKATQVLHRLAEKGILHKNTAARRISKLVKHAAKLA